MKNNSSISNKSIFGEYKNSEDRVTAALLHIFRISGPDLLKNVFDDFDINLDAEVNTQVKKGLTRPDGEMRANYHLYIESKIRPWIEGYEHNVIQLQKHQLLINDSIAKLIYITVDEQCPAEIKQSEQLYWMNWRTMISKLKEYDPIFNKDIYRFLVDQFELLIDNLVLSRYDGTTDENRVVIVGGRFAEGIAMKYKFYSCQANRYFKKSRYIAFYYDKRISHAFEIEEGPMQVNSLLKVQEKIEGNYVLENIDLQPHTFMKLGNEVVLQNCIVHNHPNSYVQKQRYTSYDNLVKAKTTDDL